MNRLSIKLRVTLWYTLFLIAVVLFVFIYIIISGQFAITSDSRNRLSNVMEQNLDEVEYEDGELDIDDDFLFFTNGVTSLIYSESQSLIGGTVPDQFQAPPPSIDGNIQQITAGSNRYYLYDRYLPSKDGGPLWLRSIILISSETGIVSAMIHSSFILLPILVVIAALGGYWITRRAFLPITAMTQAAEEITEGKDLSKRIQLKDGKDEFHLLAETINHMLSRLERSFESEKQFSSDASHELRTPVAVIKSNCEYALKHGTSFEDYRDSLETINRQTDKMTKIIASLLTITRMDQGTAKTEFEQTNISELIELICEEQRQIHAGNIQLKLSIQPDLYYLADRSLFSRMLINLIDNAYQYGKENGQIHISLVKKETSLTLSVQDDGIGIPPEHQEKIWQRFYQADASRTNEKGSLGLGLSMVKQIVDLHRGTIVVNSTPDYGSIFMINLPLI